MLPSRTRGWRGSRPQLPALMTPAALGHLASGPSAPYPDFPPSGSCWHLADPGCLYAPPLRRGEKGERDRGVARAQPIRGQTPNNPPPPCPPLFPPPSPETQAGFLGPELISLPARPSPERDLRGAAGCLLVESGPPGCGCRDMGGSPASRQEEEAQAPTWGKDWRPGCFWEKTEGIGAGKTGVCWPFLLAGGAGRAGCERGHDGGPQAWATPAQISTSWPISDSFCPPSHCPI